MLWQDTSGAGARVALFARASKRIDLDDVDDRPKRGCPHRASNFSVSKLTRYRLLHTSPAFGAQVLSTTNLPPVHLTCLPLLEHDTALSSLQGSLSSTTLLSHRTL
jgi:hypothetical protein